VGVGLLLIGMLMSLGMGTAETSPATVISAFTAFDGSDAHLIIRTVRLPRSLIALSVGAALAVAGAVMQGLTQNPLVSPDILGVNAGAAFAIVITIFLVGSDSLSTYNGVAFLGAGAAAVLVYGLGAMGRGGLARLYPIQAA
jgi:iron complex transport system permease protein